MIIRDATLTSTVGTINITFIMLMVKILPNNCWNRCMRNITSVAAYSEALFRSLKYPPAYPRKRFEDLEQARVRVQTGYNVYTLQQVARRS
jgi:hypothetical protein